jgi:membrane protease YdiL (CAAX protease family)
MKRHFFLSVFIFLFMSTNAHASAYLPYAETLSPAAVGWGNLLVPGMGASLRGDPGEGALEAGIEIGSFYGGTFFAQESTFRIDGSVLIPDNKKIAKPLIGGIMQEFGLKFHMYNTFYQYQQASLDPANEELEKQYEQPLYRGNWKDVLAAPFEWKNLSEPLVYIPIILGAGYVYWNYRTTPVVYHKHNSSGFEDSLYASSSIVSLPLGSAFGEEVLFRGFMQREIRLYTHSAAVAIATQTLVFTAMHPPENRAAAFFGGIYFGLLTNYFDGNLEPGIATHFWTDLFNGVFVYFLYRESEHRSVPISSQVTIPF